MATDVLTRPRGSRLPLWGLGLGLLIVLSWNAPVFDSSGLLKDSRTIAVEESNWETQGASGCEYGAGETGTAVDEVAFDAFIPGMRGRGACNRGGFIPGTDVIVVTNRDNSGNGSLREAMSASCPKVIIFGVAGEINISSALDSNDCDNWSIVGSSAPGNVTIFGENLNAKSVTGYGNNWTIGHLVIPASRYDDGLSFGREKAHLAAGNIAIYNSTFFWAPFSSGSGSSSIECLPLEGDEYSNILFWQNFMGITAGQDGAAIGLHLLFNSCPGANSIRNFYADAKSRAPLQRVPDYFHANNVAINFQQEFSIIQPCRGGLIGPQTDPFRQVFLNNYYADGPILDIKSTSTGSYIKIDNQDPKDCVTTIKTWEAGTAGQSGYPSNSIQDCSNHGCTSDMGSHWDATIVTALNPTNYTVETITDTQQGHEDFITKIGQHAGARPTDRITYIQDRINQSINAVDGTGPVSAWIGHELQPNPGVDSATIITEGGHEQAMDTPQSNYDPTSGTENGCGSDMPTGAAADAIQSSGLTALHEYAIDCWMDSVMPTGWRESL